MSDYFTPFSLRISKELLDKIKQIAKANKRSANKEIEFILEAHVAKWLRKTTTYDSYCEYSLDRGFNFE